MSEVCDIGTSLLILMDSLSVEEYFADFDDVELHSLVLGEAQRVGVTAVNKYLESDVPIDRLPRELMLAMLCRASDQPDAE